MLPEIPEILALIDEFSKKSQVANRLHDEAHARETERVRADSPHCFATPERDSACLDGQKTFVVYQPAYGRIFKMNTFRAIQAVGVGVNCNALFSGSAVAVSVTTVDSGGEVLRFVVDYPSVYARQDGSWQRSFGWTNKKETRATWLRIRNLEDIK